MQGYTKQEAMTRVNDLESFHEKLSLELQMSLTTVSVEGDLKYLRSEIERIEQVEKRIETINDDIGYLNSQENSLDNEYDRVGGYNHVRAAEIREEFTKIDKRRKELVKEREHLEDQLYTTRRIDTYPEEK